MGFRIGARKVFFILGRYLNHFSQYADYQYFKMKKKLTLLLIFISTLVFAQGTTEYYTSTARHPDEIEKKFPFNIDLKDVTGKIVNSKDLLKKHKVPTILVFWLTTCYPCRMEIQAYQQKYAQWKKDAKFRMIVISYDFPKNYDNYVKRVAEEKWEWETFYDVRREFGSVLPGELNGLPQVFVFDKNGELSYQKRKYYPGDEDALFQKVVELNK